MKATIIQVFDNEGNEVKNISTEIVLNGETYVKKEADKQPDYSHLVGMWVKCIELDKGWNSFFEVGKWYKVEGCNNTHPQHKGFDFNSQSWAKYNFFDLTNPQDQNPDEVKKILVPSEIWIGRTRDHAAIGIIFGVNQFLVSPDVYEQPYLTWGTDLCTPIQCELIKCEREELKKGDLAFRSSEDNPNFANQALYCVVINEDKFAYINAGENVFTDDFSSWDNWYKVTPIA